MWWCKNIPMDKTWRCKHMPADCMFTWDWWRWMPKMWSCAKWLRLLEPADEHSLLSTLSLHSKTMWQRVSGHLPTATTTGSRHVYYRDKLQAILYWIGKKAWVLSWAVIVNELSRIATLTRNNTDARQQESAEHLVSEVGQAFLFVYVSERHSMQAQRCARPQNPAQRRRHCIPLLVGCSRCLFTQILNDTRN